MRLVVLAVLAAASASISACGSLLDTGPTPTATVYLITSTLPVRATARPSDTPLPPTIPPTPVPVDGTTSSQLNVRAGPSTDSSLLGSLAIFSKIRVLGKDSTGTWYQITYPEATGGTAWITAAYVVLDGNPELGVIAPGAVGTPTSPSAAPVTVLVSGTSPAIPATAQPMATNATAALPDNDSASAPVVIVSFSPQKARSLQYTGDVSTPEGDPEDWIQFTIDGKTGQPAAVEVKIDCSGNSRLDLELHQAGSVLQAWDQLGCGSRTRLLLSLFAGPPYLLRIQPQAVGSGLSYLRYTVTVEAAL